MKDTAAPVPPSDRTRVRRGADNAHYDEATLQAIIDDAYLCHIAFSDEQGAHCIPTACWRSGGHLYIHGSNGSRLLRQLVRQTCCVAISHLDGLVLARSAFSHTMNYRSAMVYGRFDVVDDDAAKHAALAALMEKLAPGRQAEIRPGNDKEYAATTVLRISLAEAACKVRAGGPNDDADDLAWPAWAGVLPFARARMAPVADPLCAVAAPAYVRDWPTEPAELAPIY